MPLAGSLTTLAPPSPAWVLMFILTFTERLAVLVL